MRLFLILIFLYATSGQAQTSYIDTIQVRALNQDPTSTASIITIDHNEEAKNQSVADILRSVSGLEVVRQGGLGQTTSIFIRGARSEDTLVLIDGVAANDVMSPSGGFDFSSMALNNVERIEIYRGPQSVRFGAGALGGVINIISRQGSGSLQTSYFAEVGSFNTTRGSVSVSGKTNELGYAMSGGQIQTAGFSAASESYGNTEKDGATIQTGSLKLSYAPTPISEYEATLRASKALVDIDNGGGPGADDPNNTTDSTLTLAGLKGSHRFFDERLKLSAGLGYGKTNRHGKNEIDSLNTTSSMDNFVGENKKIESELEWILTDHTSVRLFLDHQTEGGSAESQYDTTSTLFPHEDLFSSSQGLSWEFASDTWFFESGARLTQNSFANIFSHRLALGRLFPASASKLLISHGSGYKLPSLYQLYSIYGFPNLKPEHSSSLEVSLEKQTLSGSNVIITIFDNKYRDIIDYNMVTSKYFNLSRATSRGLEAQALLEASENIRLQFSGAYLESKDEITGNALLRRPQTVFGTSIFYQTGRQDFSAQYSYRGSRADLDPSGTQRIRLDAYSLITVATSYKFNTAINFSARIENLTDSRYEEVAGYGTAGRSYYVGLSGEL